VLSQLTKIVDSLSEIENRISALEQEVAWIRGKLEGRSEFWADVKSWIASIVAIGAVIIAWTKERRVVMANERVSQEAFLELKKDISHLSEKIDAIANVRARVITKGATIGAIASMINLIKLFLMISCLVTFSISLLSCQNRSTKSEPEKPEPEYHHPYSHTHEGWGRDQELQYEPDGTHSHPSVDGGEQTLTHRHAYSTHSDHMHTSLPKLPKHKKSSMSYDWENLNGVYIHKHKYGVDPITTQVIEVLDQHDDSIFYGIDPAHITRPKPVEVLYIKHSHPKP